MCSCVFSARLHSYARIFEMGYFYMHVVAIWLFALMGKSNSRSLHEEPTCFSKFDFEEKVLEKLVRTEHKMELYEEHMNEIQDAVNKENSEVRLSIDNFRTEIEEMKEAISNMARRNDFLTQEAVERDMSIRKLLNNTVELAMNNISGKLQTHAVAFSAHSVADTTPLAGDTLVFTNTLLNKGGAYYPSTGIFTATVRGLYIFSVQLSVRNGNYIDAQIMNNDGIIGTVRSIGESYYEDDTGFAVVDLDWGDTVSVRIHGSSSNMVLYDNAVKLRSSFSGALVMGTQ